jgi:hypothetical protein
MAVFHLTAIDNQADYRIRQQSRYSVVISVLGDFSTGYSLKAWIKPEIDSETTYAVFNFAAPTFDDGKTTWIAWLSASQTATIPITKRKTDAVIGKTVWTWDLLLIDDNDGDNNIRLIDPSYVEVVAGVTDP